jgi:predicted ATPase
VPALAYLEQGMALYDAARHRSQAFHAGHSAAVALRSHAARSLWPLGYPARAMHRNQEALTLAQEVSHPASLAYAHAFTAMLHQLRREGELTRTEAEAAMAISHQQGLPQHWACAMILRGWALTDQGHIEEGMAEMRQGLDTWRRGAQVAQPYWLALWAEAYRRGGRPLEGLSVLSEALALVEKHAERYYEAELYRLKGELLLMQAASGGGVRAVPLEPTAAEADPSALAEAEGCFQKALEVARHQQAKSWELRTAMSLARLWQQQGKRTEAHALLAPVYHWFTEGFDTADLQEAKALLDALA